MLEISNIKVYDLEESVIASRNAMRLEPAAHSKDEFEESLKRATKLAKCGGGSGHSTFRKGIIVNFDMKYSQYITKQMQRYHWFDYISSSSLMHRLLKMDIDTYCNKYVSQEAVNTLKDDIKKYNEIEACEDTSKKWPTILRDGQLIIDDNKKDALYHAFMRCISDCPMGVELFVRVTTNYEQLATMVKQRKNHKLKEDWGEFIKFVQGLPYAPDLIPEAFS